ncbi:hypothetical protein BU14_0404s0004 [Porphyra umbilicalis]|uniref:Uncharacterized protein n=1 Tax=Porphyra umbilicalis TaxID=2786 RepID=A0A1X6NW10_PORUM|nr:hypothetical protein BU14_0404s0004 [Porphyra umbilicalis]|eukprot:OSX72777.1 hypothetical protein BU14_0404s0004 [Porphyra umbilicalis]
MLTKFETKSNRVKGLAFHPQRPWVLSSLHNGAIQLWDYRMGTLIDRYDEHEGPVRSVDFHPTQPLFVSGGDDYKIKVWNYKLRRCVFTLYGHLDYIRTVSFHPESPWIVSASDDQTVRIWNWQNRSCLAVLSGHNHYVMSASFHPAEDLVVSASLDLTVRVWDISALRQKAVRPSDMISSVRGQLPPSVNADLFGTMDATVRHVLEGHTRGANWASFHPTLPLIVSGGDDRHVKLWRMSDTKAWEMDTLRGHLNNVSCTLFHPRADLVLTASEDKTIRVWDLNRRSCIHTFRREADRFWILAAHPTVNLLAAGHDNGMLVFKLQRERPAYTMTDAALMYVKDRYLRVLDFNNGRDSPLATVRQAAASMFDNSPFLGGGFGGGSSSSATGATLQPPPRSMSFNSVERAVLLNYDADGGSYELFTGLPKDGMGNVGSGNEPVADMRRGRGVSAVFVGRNRFAVLDKASGIVSVRDLRNVETKQVPSPLPGADALFAAGNGFVLVRSEEQVALLDLQQRKVVAELAATHIKYVVWSEGMKRVALLGKHVILIASRRLELLATVHETIRVKSAAWDDSGVLLYSTLNHVKYCLPNGDSGTVATLPHPLYLTRVRGPALCYLDREGAPGILAIDPTEYAFKLLLLRKRYDDVKRMISDNRLRGQAIIAYLQAKGFPEVALHFVRDEPTRFALAIASGSIDVALTAAQALDEPDVWRRLATEALRQGNVEMVELCYQRAKDLDRLAFLYVITGNFDKLAKMAKIAAARGQVAARFQIANYLGDVPSRVALLRDCGQPALARLTAGAHGLAEELAEELPPAVAREDGEAGDDSAAIAAQTRSSSLLLPPVPLSEEFNWPLLSVSRGLFQRDPNAKGAFEEPPAGDYYEDAAAFEASERELGDDDGPSRATITAPPAAPVVDPFAAGLDARAQRWTRATVVGATTWTWTFPTTAWAAPMGMRLAAPTTTNLGWVPRARAAPTASIMCRRRSARPRRCGGRVAPRWLGSWPRRGRLRRPSACCGDRLGSSTRRRCGVRCARPTPPRVARCRRGVACHRRPSSLAARRSCRRWRPARSCCCGSGWWRRRGWSRKAASERPTRPWKASWRRSPCSWPSRHKKKLRRPRSSRTPASTWSACSCRWRRRRPSGAVTWRERPKRRCSSPTAGWRPPTCSWRSRRQ